MRRAAALVTAVAAMAAALLAASGGARASCPGPGMDGVVPGSAAQTTTVAGTFYLDDRGGVEVTPVANGPSVGTDWDNDNNASGVWLYQESNSKAGLQRGGDSVTFVVLGNFNLPPTISPITVGNVTLFPNGYPPNGNSWAKELGQHDYCIQHSPPDRLLL